MSGHPAHGAFANPPCPSCGAERVAPFYEVRDVPAHSCLMLRTRHEALAFPRGDLALALCRRCGFITNVAYDASLQAYSPDYEDQQSYSPTFNAFAHGLAERLIARYDLHGKTIVELGCGKGDFLLLLCELGGNRGLGIDPTAAPERVASEAAGRVRFVREDFTERSPPLQADLVCCRHTLEHVPATGRFMRALRDGIGGRLETAVFFEVPDVVRVLRERAFWDTYYEHCSYFSPGSLARLFRASGFEVVDLARDYGDQYLLIEARPAPTASTAPAASTMAHELEDAVAAMARDVEGFARDVPKAVADWRRRLACWRDAGKRVLVWGSGSKCVAFLTALGASRLEYVVDINPHRHGRFLPGLGQEIMPPAFVQAYRPDSVIVMNPIYRDEIRRMLAAMNVEADLITV